MTKKVYLSGGFVTSWQEEVMEAVPEAEFYNPKDFDMAGLLRTPVDIYAPMDRIQIEDSDIVFGYLEASNPTPINIVAECCYAKALGKIVVLCNEWTEENIKRDNLRATQFKDENGRTWFRPHYLDLVCYWLDFVETDFGHAINILRRLVEMYISSAPTMIKEEDE